MIDASLTAPMHVSDVGGEFDGRIRVSVRRWCGHTCQDGNMSESSSENRVSGESLLYRVRGWISLDRNDTRDAK